MYNNGISGDIIIILLFLGLVLQKIQQAGRYLYTDGELSDDIVYFNVQGTGSEAT